MCDSSTPLEVITKITSPHEVIEQLHMLCCDTPSWLIMSSCQTTSASCPPPTGSSAKGPSFSSSSNPSVSRQRTTPRLLTNQSFSPSTSTVEQIPCSGQSCTRPVGSFSLECCQRNS